MVRRMIGALLALIGIAVLSAGVLAATRFGSAGRWPVDTAAADASAVHLGPGVLQRVDGPVEVRVRDSGPGEVQIAQAPAADVAAAVAGSDVARAVDPTGLPRAIELRPGTGHAYAAPADTFSEVASGRGEVTMTVPRDVRRAVVVSAPGRHLDDAVVTVTYQHPGWTWSALGVAAGGAVLTALGLALLRPRRRVGIAEHLPRRRAAHRAATAATEVIPEVEATTVTGTATATEAGARTRKETR